MSHSDKTAMVVAAKGLLPLSVLVTLKLWPHSRSHMFSIYGPKISVWLTTVEMGAFKEECLRVLQFTARDPARFQIEWSLKSGGMKVSYMADLKQRSRPRPAPVRQRSFRCLVCFVHKLQALMECNRTHLLLCDVCRNTMTWRNVTVNVVTLR